MMLGYLYEIVLIKRQHNLNDFTYSNRNLAIKSYFMLSIYANICF